MNSTQLLKLLTDGKVEFVVVGGVAATIHGSAFVTLDLDLCIPFSHTNMTRLLAAMKTIHPVNRMRPDRPTLSQNVEDLEGFKNLYLFTDLGQLDFLSAIEGVGDYSQCFQESFSVQIDDVAVQVLGLNALIRCKRALARAKDLLVANELTLLHASTDAKAVTPAQASSLACRVCGFLHAVPSWGTDGTTPTNDCCSCCGVESGYQDATPISARRFRSRWISNGAHWASPTHRPNNWNLDEQLTQVPAEYK